MASPQKPVFSLAITNPKWVRAYVSEVDLGKVHPGMAASIVVDSFPDHRFDGWVGFISPVAEFTPKTVQMDELRTSLVYEVRVFVKDPTDNLRLGMPATVLLPLNGGAAAPSTTPLGKAATTIGRLPIRTRQTGDDGRGQLAAPQLSSSLQFPQRVTIVLPNAGRAQKWGLTPYNLCEQNCEQRCVRGLSPLCNAPNVAKSRR